MFLTTCAVENLGFASASIGLRDLYSREECRIPEGGFPLRHFMFLKKALRILMLAAFSTALVTSKLIYI